MKKYFISVLFIVAFFTSTGQQWYWVSPLPQGNNIHTSSMTTDGTDYLGGECGTLLKTTDYGNSWTLLEGKLSGSVWDVQFINADTGYAISTISPNSSCFYRTYNGGIDWDSAYFYDFSLISLHFINHLTGFIAGYDGIFLKTTDGGNTWIINYSTPEDVAKMFALNDQTVFISGWSGHLYKTLDGGTTWTALYSGFSEAMLLHYFDDQTGIATSSFEGFTRKTYNSGIHWYIKDYTEIDAMSLQFFDNNNGIISCRNGDVLSSLDGGESWSRHPYTLEPPDWFFYTGAFANPSRGIFAGSSGQISLTNDGGTSHQKIDRRITNNHLACITYINDSTGYIGSNHGLIFKSDDHWNTWDTLTVPFDGNVVKLEFPDEYTGYAQLNYSDDFIYKTTDGGNSWERIEFLVGVRIGDMKFFSATKGLVTSRYGLYQTNDGGLTWTFTETDPEYYLDRLSFADAETGYLTGSDYFGHNGIVCKTTDGGQNWAIVNHDLRNINNIKAVTADTIYATRWDGMFYKSTNGGITWDSLYSVIEAGITNVGGINFSDTKRGICFGHTYYQDPIICTTSDGGLTWHKSKETTSAFLGSYMFPESGVIYLVGQFGALIRNVPSVPVSVKKYDKKPSLSIIPNPAKDFINISIAGPSSGDVTLKIFNSDGQSVYAGSYNKNTTLHIDVSNLKPGVYSAVILYNGSIATGKFIKL